MSEAESLRIIPEVEAALANGRPVVALESSVIAQGLPIPQNRDAAERMIAAVRRAGAVPAITAVTGGQATVGLTDRELERFLNRDGIRKISARDIAPAAARNEDGATTVAASLVIASLAQIDVFATGGIGGVHRGAPYDESADLLELSRNRIIVVCAGAKSILDLPATWERLETLGVTVVGFRTRELPGFYTAETGIELTTSVDTVEEVAEIWTAHCSLGRQHALVVVQAPPAQYALRRDTADGAVTEALENAARDGIFGAAVTPYLLAAVTRLTGGVSLDANLALLEQNASLAGEIATFCADSNE